MLELELKKQSFKSLEKIKRNNPSMAKHIKSKIDGLRNWSIHWKNLVWWTDYKRLRVWDFRIIYKIKNETLTIYIIEKRETIYINLYKKLQ